MSVPGIHKHFGQASRHGRLASVPALALGVLIASGQGPAAAETLANALAKAAAGNPEIGQGRSAVRIGAARVEAEEAANYPRLSASTDFGLYRTQSLAYPYTGHADLYGNIPRGGSLNAGYTLFDGGRAANAIWGAKRDARSAEATAIATEQDLLRRAVAAYFDVLVAESTLALRRVDVETLQLQLKNTADRLAVSDVTRTDLEQVRAQLSGARAALLTAMADMQAAAAAYQNIVGDAPVALTWSGPLDGLPKSRDDAVARAMAQHPAIRAAQLRIEAARAEVGVAEAEMSPVVSIDAGVGRRWDAQSSFRDRNTVSSVTGTLTLPIYQGGGPTARVRQAKERVTKARLEADQQTDQVRTQALFAWAQWGNSAGVLDAARAQVTSAEAALNGLREEVKAGQRTTFDLLQALTYQTSAEISALTALRNRIVSSYNVAWSTGALSVNSADRAAKLAGPPRRSRQLPLRAPALDRSFAHLTLRLTINDPEVAPARTDDIDDGREIAVARQRR